MTTLGQLADFAHPQSVAVFTSYVSESEAPIWSTPACCIGSLPSLWVAAHHRAATTATPRRPYGAGGGEDCRPWSRSRLSMRAPLPTTDALFAQAVEQQMSNLLAGFGAVGGFELRCDAS